jgi:hypothetical protein
MPPWKCLPAGCAHEPADALTPVNVIVWVTVPRAFRAPATFSLLTTPAWNCTSTPGATVSVAPAATVTPAAQTTYGLPVSSQVVLVLKVPDTQAPGAAGRAGCGALPMTSVSPNSRRTIWDAIRVSVETWDGWPCPSRLWAATPATEWASRVQQLSTCATTNGKTAALGRNGERQSPFAPWPREYNTSGWVVFPACDGSVSGSLCQPLLCWYPCGSTTLPTG